MNDALKALWRGPGPPAFSFAAIVFALCLGACTDPDSVRIRLHAQPPTDQAQLYLEIQAQVSGAATGLRYKWFSVAGSCEPQQTERPATIFRFADGATRDLVSVEVWRDNRRVAEAGLPVMLDEGRARLATENLAEMAQIEITTIPPYEDGGPDTRADIAGKVSGKLSAEYSVIVYARATEIWYIQPNNFTAHPILPDNTWKTWTHTGTSYAALLVRPGFQPVSRLDVLPQVGGYVVARTIVEGKRELPK